jgi:hypothetical protein
MAPRGSAFSHGIGGALSGATVAGTVGTGMNLGGALGNAINSATGATGFASGATSLGSALGGGALGAYLGLKAVNRIKDELDYYDEQKKKPAGEKSAMSTSAFDFGHKFANSASFYERVPKEQQKKPNPLNRAVAAGEEHEPELFNDMGDKEEQNKESAAFKFAKSLCQPCDMSKHDKSKYQTGPMRALAAEEAVTPENGGVETTEETEHSEKDIHNSGQKESAYKQASPFLKAIMGGLGTAAKKVMPSAAKVAPKVAPAAPALRLPSAPLVGAQQRAALSATSGIPGGRNVVLQNQGSASARDAVAAALKKKAPPAQQKTLKPPPLPTKETPAALERRTGRILDAQGRPVPQKAPPPVPAKPLTAYELGHPGIMAEVEAARNAATAAPIKISPAEAAAGRAKITIPPVRTNTPVQTFRFKGGAAGFGEKMAVGAILPTPPESSAPSMPSFNPLENYGTEFKNMWGPYAETYVPEAKRIYGPAAENYGHYALQNLKTVGNALNNARLWAGHHLGDKGYAVSKFVHDLAMHPSADAWTNSVPRKLESAKLTPGSAPKPEAAPAAPAAPPVAATSGGAAPAPAAASTTGSSLMPFLGGAGLSAAGLLALYHYMHQQKPRKRRDDEE